MPQNASDIHELYVLVSASSCAKLKPDLFILVKLQTLFAQKTNTTRFDAQIDTSNDDDDDAEIVLGENVRIVH